MITVTSLFLRTYSDVRIITIVRFMNSIFTFTSRYFDMVNGITFIHEMILKQTFIIIVLLIV